MGISYNTHKDVKLEILPIRVEVFLRHLSFCRRKAFYEDGYKKINELNDGYKGNLISCFTPSEIKLLNWILKNPF